MMSYRLRPLPDDDETVGPRLFLTDHVVSLLDMHLPKVVGDEGHENVAYVGGYRIGDDSFGTAVLMPPVRTAPRRYDTDLSSHAKVMGSICDLELEVVAQVHTHPGHGVYHSDGDDDLAFVKGEGFWSIVVPAYAAKGFLPLEQCGFHRYQQEAFHLLTQRAVLARVSIQPCFTDLRN